jgi:hypothetical protein
MSGWFGLGSGLELLSPIVVSRHCLQVAPPLSCTPVVSRSPCRRPRAFGHFSHNYQQSYNGRKGVIVSGVAALLIGASQELISFFFSAGLKLH